jgi:membrane protein
VPPLREPVRALLRAYRRNELLTFASAIAFQLAFALIPFTLFALGLLGALGLEDVWKHDVVPDLHSSVSPAAFTLINSTALKVLGSKNLFWVTAGLVIAVWEMSAGMRAVMGAFDRIYGTRRSRSPRERYLVSIGLAIAVGLLLMLAIAVFMLGPLVSGVVTIVRWPASAALLLTAIAVELRFAPADPQPIRWVSLGSGLVVGAWLATSLAFAFYIRDIADYGTVYGALAVVIIAFEYLYLASAAFLTGAQLDQLARERART